MCREGLLPFVQIFTFESEPVKEGQDSAWVNAAIKEGVKDSECTRDLPVRIGLNSRDTQAFYRVPLKRVFCSPNVVFRNAARSLEFLTLNGFTRHPGMNTKAQSLTDSFTRFLSMVARGHYQRT